MQGTAWNSSADDLSTLGCFFCIQRVDRLSIPVVVDSGFEHYGCEFEVDSVSNWEPV